MELGTIFGREDYFEAYKYAQVNDCDIIRVAARCYKIVKKTDITLPVLTKDEVEAIRAELYRNEVDPLMSEYNRKKLFNLFKDGEEAELMQSIQDKVAEIKHNNPYPVDNRTDVNIES